MENIQSSTPAPETNSAPETSTGNSNVGSTASPVSTPASTSQTKQTPSREEITSHSARIEQKVRDGVDLDADDLKYFDQIQSEEVKKVAEDKKRFNGELVDETPEEGALEEGLEGEEQVTQDPDAYTPPEDHVELYKLTGAKNPQELHQILDKNYSRIEQAIEWKQKADGEFQRLHQNFENATDLIEALVSGDERAKAHAIDILVKAGRNPHKSSPLPPRENFLTDADYEFAKRTYEENAATKNELAQIKQAQKEESQRLQQEANTQKAKSEIYSEVTSMFEKYSELGLSPMQGRQALQTWEKSQKDWKESGRQGMCPPPKGFERMAQLMEIAESKGINLEDAFAIYAFKNKPTLIKEEVEKYTNPKLKPSVGVSGVQSKAPAAPGGKFTRADVQKMITNNDYPKEWTITLSDGSTMLNPKQGAIPDYISNIIQDLL